MIDMEDDIVFCARTGRRIIDGNVVSIQRHDDKPRLIESDPIEPRPSDAKPIPENDDI